MILFLFVFKVNILKCNHLEDKVRGDVLLIVISKKYYIFNSSLVRWGTPGNCSNHGEILEHPGGIKTELKY